MQYDAILGGTFALTSALLWAVCAVIFRNLGNDVAAPGMSLGKGIIAALLSACAIWPAGVGPLPAADILRLAASGILGIALGDTLFFKSLVALGPRVSLALTALIPATTACLSVLILKERLSLFGLFGAVLTIAGIIIVLWEKAAPAGKTATDRAAGIKYGLFSVLCCSAAIILSKEAVGSVSVSTAFFVRQAAGVLGLVCWGLAGGRLPGWVGPFADMRLAGKLAAAAFLGTFLGTMFSLLALKYSDAAIATTLNSTSPVFIVPVAYFALREKPGLLSALGAALAMLGVAVIFLKGI